VKVRVVGGGPGGLYLALLVKKEWPDASVEVLERNRPDDTFGFGVVFSDETLALFRDYDAPSYEAIRRAFAYWGDVDVHYQGHVLRAGGNGFAGCSRQTLLSLLQARCLELGVRLRFQTEVAPESLETWDADLIVAADGINSRIREHFRDHFQPEVSLGHDPFCWMGSTRELDAFKYFFRMTEHGLVLAHCYQYEPGMSTWVIELSQETFARFGFGAMSEAEYKGVLEDVFKEELDGHPLLTNRSIWRRFPTIRCERWVKDNVVLLGDAKATAHYSIGSGTKLAMEDAAALFEALRANPDVGSALHAFEAGRREEVEKTQHAANVSLWWFENMGRYWGMSPEQFAFGVMSRSKQITYENLMLRDAGFVERVERDFLERVRAQGFGVRDGTPPMFTPFKLRDMHLVNRVVVSPMAQYRAKDGVPNDWHFVHLTSRAVGGAGLVFAEMTCPSPDARITPGCTGLWNDQQRDAFARIAAFVHAETPAKLCMQLGHAGRKGSTQLGWEKADYPLPEGNWPIYSASAIPYHEGSSQTPKALGEADMARITGDFARSARYADEAGYDMLEIHMAHGYLLASFISPLTNRRTDGYGGTIENRMRFPLQVFRACRSVWPDHKPMSARLSASDWYPGGLSEEDLLAAARLLKDAGADLIDVSTGQTVPGQKPVYGRMYQTPFADAVRHEVGVATMSVGNITTPDQVNTILLQGRADLVALARPHLTDPYFTLHAAAHYGYRQQFWPKPYLTGAAQAYRLAAREREELRDLRLKAKPPTHEVTEADAAADTTADTAPDAPVPERV
jgi:anthraniloyl-CoA monooxygenase